LIAVYPATPALSRYVINYLVYDLTQEGSQSEPMKAVIYPDTTSIGCFVWGEPVRATNQQDPKGNSRSGISGFQTRRFEVEGSGKLGIVVARFTALGIRCLIPCSPVEFVDVRVNYCDVFGPSAVHLLEERLFELKTPAARIECIERFLLSQLRIEKADPLVESATRVLWTSGGQTSMAKLADQHELSVSALRRRFVQAVGVGPKRFARVVRLQQALIRFRECRSWADTAASTGFYDQAHLIRECRDMLIETPQCHVDLPALQCGIRSSGHR
jgi:AraC-like DNA-binding protein